MDGVPVSIEIETFQSMKNYRFQGFLRPFRPCGSVLWEDEAMVSDIEIFHQLRSPSFRFFGLDTTHEFPIARVFSHVNAAFVPFETKATNFPFAHLFRGLPRPDFPARPAFAEAREAHTVSPLSVTHTCTSDRAERLQPQKHFECNRDFSLALSFVSSAVKPELRHSENSSVLTSTDNETHTRSLRDPTSAAC